MVSIPEIDGLTQTRRLSEAESMAREHIAVTLDVPLSTVEVTIRTISVDDVAVSDEAAAIQRDRTEAARLNEEATARAERLAKALVEHAVPIRDIGTVLRVSHQRAHQLASHVANAS
ncbi:hypothetical protein NF557_13750 [Ornithinimicrobium cryptoxanthini]|uniref:Uncharacterized protein n=1 Tax=Ornithinimicrobium cryptoxanthini TaxID=2934161 RepID=A0ABY4YGK5_9MICO|nr:hypothetical protein [Ornithinimicrobium cryptoxanthini]USQ75666.1 hypothetical protein NF557_13750 [Ornithinimicrobium cryptoxanthini]